MLPDSLSVNAAEHDTHIYIYIYLHSFTLHQWPQSLTAAGKTVNSVFIEWHLLTL